jgi:serine/threonine protein kinase
MAKISHPNVLPVYDVGQYEGRIFVAMEYVEGPTLGDWVRKAKPAWNEIVEAYVAAGRGLAAAHTLGLVHRDFKPHNVLLATGGRPQVMDFGLARTASMPTEATSWSLSLSSDDDSDEETVASLTETGRVVGTPRYMSPEQHQGPNVDARSDQYCFCAALYESLYGIKPFGGGGLKRIGRRKIRGQLQPPPRNTKVPTRILEILERGLDPDPDARWPELGELLDALERPPRAPSLLSRILLPIAGVVLSAGMLAMPRMDGGSWTEPDVSVEPEQPDHATSDRAWPELELARRELGLGHPRRARQICQFAFTESLASNAREVSIDSAALMAEIETELGNHDEALHWARTARALSRAPADRS